MGYPLRMLPLMSHDRITSQWWRHDFSLKCFFKGSSCQNLRILEHNVPLYGVFIWSSRIVDPELLTSLMTSSRNNLCRNFGATYLGNDAR